MLHIIRLETSEIKEAIKEYLAKRGIANIKSIRARDMDFVDVDITEAKKDENNV